MDAQPLELVIGNIVRRVLFIIREEHAGKLKETQPQGQHTPPEALLDEVANAEEQLGVPVPNLRTAVMEAIGDLQLEVRFVLMWIDRTVVCVLWSFTRSMETKPQLENAYGEICELALEHIHANEVILTVGRSRTTEKFLKVRWPLPHRPFCLPSFPPEDRSD